MKGGARRGIVLEKHRQVALDIVVGLDFSMGMLRRAKAKALSLGLCNVALVQAAANALPFKPETFHAVTCSSSPRKNKIRPNQKR